MSAKHPTREQLFAPAGREAVIEAIRRARGDYEYAGALLGVSAGTVHALMRRHELGRYRPDPRQLSLDVAPRKD